MKDKEVHIKGTCKDRFSKVKDAFIGNFRNMGEIGARVSIIQENETVVDLWGGYIDEEQTKEWTENTFVNTMSISKGIVALAAHILADRGLLDYEESVSSYWSEFAQNGKEKITVKQLLSHMASIAIIDDTVPGDVLNWDNFIKKIEKQAPNWEPGTNPAYHSITYGFLIGELVHKIDGRKIKQFIEEEITKPLDADYILGCSDNDLPRIVRPIMNLKNEMMAGGGLMNENTKKQFASLPEDPTFFASADHWKAVIPSSSGVTNAYGICRIFASLANGGAFNGNQLFQPKTITAMKEEQWNAKDSIFGNQFRVTMGLLLHQDFNYFGREGNLGSAGAGGYTVFADPDNRLSFGYTPVRFTTGSGLGDEPKMLIDALYSCL